MLQKMTSMRNKGGNVMKKCLSVLLTLLVLMTCIPLVSVSVSAADYEYAYFPGNVLKVTQGAYGEYNSYSHNGQGGYYQNAFDLGGNSNYCAPFSGTITSIKTSYNAVVLQSDNKVYWANGTLDYMSVTFVHDNDISDLYVGKYIAQGEVFYQPGIKDPGGYTTGTHLHLCVNKGKTTEGIRYFSGDTRPNEALFLKNSVSIQQTGNYTWKKTSTPTPTTSYGTYYIKNNGNGKYLDVANATDANAQNIQTVSFNGSNAQKYEIALSTTTAGYSMRPLSSVSRMVNVYAETVVSGKNVCIYDNTGHDSQRWNFEKVSGGYVIRNVQNSNCVLDVESNGNVYVSTYTGAATQIWTFQDVNCSHSYDNACDATCNKCGMDRSVSGHNWVSATCTAAKTCANCGTTEGAALGHNWVDATCIVPKTCSVCGGTDGVASGHNWDTASGCCTICGKSASAEYSEWSEELPTDITEDLFDIESKTVYRYRDNSSHVSYGAWSSEKTTSTKPTASDTLTIVSTTTYYNYYHYCCNYYDGSYNVDSIPYGSGNQQYHTIRLTYELSAKNVGDKGGKTLYGSYTCGKGFNVWAKADLYITYEYKYKTRTKTDVVDYGTWTDWTDTEPSTASNRNIETKTLYRYKLKHTHAWADVTHSVMDTKSGNGLAFRFELTAKGVMKNQRNVIDLTNATVNYLGKECKLIGMGTVVTNDDTIGATEFTLEDVYGVNVVNVPTVYLQEADEDSCAFATRIIDIPGSALERTIYARPYFIVEVDGEEITVYGDVDSASCAEYL